MKKALSFAVIFCLLIGLAACGGAADSSAESASPSETPAAESAAPDESAVTSEASDYIVPETWTTVENDGTWSYTLTETAEEDRSPYLQDDAGCCYTLDDDLTLTRCSDSGEILYTIELPSLAEEIPAAQDAFDTSEFIEALCFSEDGVFIVQSCFWYLDEEYNDFGNALYLEHWSAEGEELLQLDLEDAFGISDISDNMLTGLALSPSGDVILAGMESVWLLNSDGLVKENFNTDGSWLYFRYDRDGRLYFTDNEMLYTIDWDNFAVGEPVLEINWDTIAPGGGDYDFFLYNETELKGVNLSTGTITEILSWNGLDLSGGVSFVEYVDEETFQVGYYDYVTWNNQYLSLHRVPADEIPEKTQLTLAVALTDRWEHDWTESLNQMLSGMINSFNRSSDAYRIDVVTYGSATDLNLMLLSGDAPDLIYWDGDDLDEIPSSQNYAKHGYLTDLEPLIEADPDLSMDDFVPNLIGGIQDSYNGLYIMPLGFTVRTLAGLTENVGAAEGWSIHDMLSVMEQMPEDMYGYYDNASGFLEYILDTSLGQFVDMAAGTCNFEVQEFYDLLTLCRDYFSTEDFGEDSPFSYSETDVYTGTTLLCTMGGVGNLSAFGAEYISNADSLTCVGYPGAGGNGGNIIPYYRISICALSEHQDAAWSFLRTLLTYDAQKDVLNRAATWPVRTDALLDREAGYVENNPDYTQEGLDAAYAYILGAESLYFRDNPIPDIVLEEAEAFFAGDKSPEETAAVLQSRVSIYLAEQS